VHNDSGSPADALRVDIENERLVDYRLLNTLQLRFRLILL